MRHHAAEERFNSLSHLIGLVLAVPAAVVLVVLAARRGDPWHIVAFSVYGVSLFSLYLFSYLYHGARPGPLKLRLQTLDHIGIYLLIAGSYTPFTLVTLRGPWGWSVFGVVWALALLGIGVELLNRSGTRVLPMVLYFLMGWLMVVAAYPLLQVFPAAGLGWLLAGGLFYTVGIVFYALNHRIRYGHGVWHLFVLAGSASHYFTILHYMN